MSGATWSGAGWVRLCLRGSRDNLSQLDSAVGKQSANPEPSARSSWPATQVYCVYPGNKATATVLIVVASRSCLVLASRRDVLGHYVVLVLWYRLLWNQALPPNSCYNSF
ncbi:hypothetical protein J6590_052266 [Homalodisca vitripennis]|nr:hypothetical protein J6590_052266 [Homalodisca vitripennis]